MSLQCNCLVPLTVAWTLSWYVQWGRSVLTLSAAWLEKLHDTLLVFSTGFWLIGLIYKLID